jgi:hypothetical protein
MTTSRFLTRSLLAAAIAGANLLAACGGGSDGTAPSNTTTATTPGPTDTTSGDTTTTTSGDTTSTGSTDTTSSTDTASADTSGVTTADDMAQIAALQQALQQAAGVPGTAVLSWKPNANVVSYRVYYGTSSRSYLQNLGGGLPAAIPALTVTGLTAGQTYYFSVTGVDANGKETAYSDEMTKVVS